MLTAEEASVDREDTGSLVRLGGAGRWVERIMPRAWMREGGKNEKSAIIVFDIRPSWFDCLASILFTSIRLGKLDLLVSWKVVGI